MLSSEMVLELESDGFDEHEKSKPRTHPKTMILKVFMILPHF